MEGYKEQLDVTRKALERRFKQVEFKKLEKYDETKEKRRVEPNPSHTSCEKVC